MMMMTLEFESAISYQEVEHALKGMPMKKSPEFDHITTELLVDRVIGAHNPREIKRLGSSVSLTNCNEWNTLKKTILLELVRV